MITKLRLIIVLSLFSPVLYAAPYPFTDDLESGLGAWNVTAPWGLSGLSSVSPTQCVADSPAGYYTNGTDASLTLGSGMDLSSAVRPALGFWHRYELEQGWDFATVEISTNAGVAWSALSADYTGTRSAWAREQIDLASAVGASDVRVRFRIRTDSSVVMDGWFIDNIRVGEKPAATTLYPPAGITANAMTLSWTASSDPGFAAYRLYRVTGTNLDWHTARLVAEIASAAATNFTDNTLCPKSHYAYRLMVLATNGLHSLSGEVSAQTAAGMDFPFMDNGEAGGGIWVADPPWALSSESSASPTNAWTDSPGAPYSNNLASCALTLAAPVNLTGVATPVLVFKHRYAFQANDYGNVEYSTNSGSGWAVLTNYSGRTLDEWKTVRLHLAACSDSGQVLVRFRITTDASGVTNGWSLDDLSVSAAPGMITAPVLSEIGPHSIRLTWTAATETAFSRYEIYRDTNSSVGLESTLAGVVSDRSVTSFVNTALASDVTYYYRIYAVNPVGGISLDSPSAASASTIVQTIPFSDSFSSNLVAWTVTGTWGIETGFLSDSPAGASYTNNSISEARTTVNLTGSVWPVLKFWDRYHVAVGDVGFVEVSPDGGTWTRLYGIMNGAETNWTQRVIDLSPWRNQSNLRVRYILYTDGGTVDDGWQVDDVVVEDRGEVTQGSPFYDGFEGGLSNWFGGEGVWVGVSGTNAPYAGTNAAQSVAGFIPPSAEYEVQLDKPLNLAGTVSPQLTFWSKWALGARSYYGVEVSVDQGLNWTALWAVDGWGGAVSDWQRTQISLKDYRQTSVRIRWRVSSPWGAIPTLNLSVDKVSVQEQPGPLVMTSAVPHLRTMDLGWSPVTNLNDFARWEVYRSPDANVDLADTKVGTFGDSNVVTMVDSNLSLGVTYYYAAYAVDSDDMYTRTTNVMSGTTWQAPSLLPMSNSAESVDAWYTTGTWGVDTNSPHNGSTCLSDSPGGNYTNGANGEARLAVNLTGSVWPVLKFWDRYHVAVGDVGFVEVSPDGGTWTRLYGILNGAETNWTQRVIDLSPWRNQSNLRVRYILYTDGGTVDDGWQVDDVVVEDRGEVTQGSPFYDGFEGGLSNWFGGEGVWVGVSGTNAPYAGTNAAQSVAGFIPPSAEYEVQLDKPLNLAGTVSPQLTFWSKWALGARSYYGVEVSVDQGLNWTALWAVDGWGGAVSDWQRTQISLKDYRQTSVRIRWRVSSPWGAIPTLNLSVDKVSVQEQPGPLVMTSAVPHLRTMDLGWSPVTNLNDFARWEVYRSPDANVDLADTKVGTFGDSNVVTMVDSNLSLGVTYYYAAYAVDSDDMYTRTTNVMSGTTWQAPSLLPMSNSAESVDAWYTTGTWGVDTNSPHNGSTCLSDSPGGNYTNGANGEARLAVNLTGSVWPVLKFWDRYHVAVGDVGFVEVSPDGGTWTRIYGILNGAETNWTQRVIDLSPWRNQSNLRVRYILYTDGGTVDDGWQVDDVVVEDRGEVTQGSPFYDGFEGGLSNWFGGEGVWVGVSGTNAPYAGTNAAQSVAGFIPPSAEYEVQLDKPLNLAGTVSPQLTFWSKWALGARSYYGVEVSVDQGLNWTALWAVDGWGGAVSDWQRTQISLKDYRQTSVRIRWRVSSPWGAIPTLNLSVDKVSVQEQPTPPVLTTNTPDLTTIEIQWTPTALGSAFQRYEVYRSPDGTVDLNDLRIAQPSAESVTNFVDAGLVRGATYYYAVYVVDQNDTYVRSTAVLSGTTRTIAWSNFTESATNLDQWDRTGSWGIETNGGVTCLSDSPGGVYGNNSNYWINTSIRMTGVNWPLLHFREQYRLAQGDWGWVEISTDGGGWIAVYGIGMGVVSNWTDRVIDLSEWKNQANLRVRFRLQTDGAGVEDGWQLDDIWFGENSAVLGSPLFDDLEKGLDRWLEGTSTWMTGVTNLAPVVGTNAAGDTVYQIAPSSRYVMELKGALDLSQTLDPQLTFWARWDMSARSWLGAQLSIDGGLTWGTPWGVDGWGGAASDWTRIQVSIAGYRQPNVRFRFIASSPWGAAPEISFGFDYFGIGDRAPGQPALILPGDLGNSALLRPLLVVSNAVDAQGDPLTYRFEVFDTVDLTNLIAQVPIVSGGLDTTSWEVSPDLVNQRQYWWRCRAYDGVYTGLWSATSSFYVNQTFNPPAAVVIAGPPPGAIVGRGTLLTWFPSSDVDAGDSVYRYQVQIDNTNTFASPEVDDATIPSPGVVTSADWTLSRELGALSGNGNLVTNTVYYWRIRAEDTRSEYSEWSSGVWWFIFGTPPPDVGKFSFRSGSLSFGWERTDTPVYIYGATNLCQQVWDLIQGPVYGTNITISVGTNEPARFYKLLAE